MRKLAGIFGALILIIGVTGMIEPNFLSVPNLSGMARWTGLFAFLAIGQAFVIISGGIDLSVGSVVGLIGTLLPLLLREHGMGVAPALTVVMLISLLIGLAHGLLIAKLRLQPFIVTLCGLFIYRGLARYVAHDEAMGFGIGYKGLRYLATGQLAGVIPMPAVLVVVVGIAAAFFLNRTVWGQYLLALGRNEQAARFSGIRTDRVIILAYILSALLAGVAGVLFALDLNSVQPSVQGNFFELYAVAGAVLGGCSLRGGEGSILGVILGTAILQVLRNTITVLGISSQLEFAVIGIVILIAVMTDEMIKRVHARRRISRSSQPE